LSCAYSPAHNTNDTAKEIVLFNMVAPLFLLLIISY